MGMMENVFDAYVDAWLAETQGYSSISSITRHPNFGAIVSMGLPAMEFILARMERGEVHVHWFPALKEISGGADPVPPNERGNLNQMAVRWIEWGRRLG